jgi:hypothetical protein
VVKGLKLFLLYRQAKRCTFVIPNDTQPVAELHILCLAYLAIAGKTDENDQCLAGSRANKTYIISA